MGIRRDVYRELFRIVDRDVESDRLHRMRILAILHARSWAAQAGFTFEWTKTPEQTDDHCWTVWACLDGKRIDWSDG
jgi:hypothetical protein